MCEIDPRVYAKHVRVDAQGSRRTHNALDGDKTTKRALTLGMRGVQQRLTAGEEGAKLREMLRAPLRSRQTRTPVFQRREG